MMRRFGLVGLIAAAAFLLESLLPQVRAQPARNVVFIMGDDHATFALGAYGSPRARTPNLDRLAAQGVRFDRAYASSPMCNPARQAILTSQLPHALGVNYLFTPLDVADVTIADHLAGLGFETAAIGKMHFNGYGPNLERWGYPEEYVQRADEHHGFRVRVDRGEYREWLAQQPPRRPPPGTATRPPGYAFDDVDAHWNTAALPDSVYHEQSEGYFFAEEAIAFMEEHRDDRFCLWLSFREPHSPFNFALEDAGTYDPADMPIPPVSAEDERWRPEVFEGLTAEQVQGTAAAYYTSVVHLDRNVGRVLDYLDRSGLADETLVVYVGDHGYLVGHHGRFEKHMMWEEAVRAPLLMRLPERLGAGRVVDELVEFIDLVPTMLDLLGVGPMPTAHGRSLVPLLDGLVDRHRLYVYSEFLVDDKAMVRTPRYKYIFTAGRQDLRMGFATGEGASGVVHRLYDLYEDPGETHSVADRPTYRPVLERLQRLMLERFLGSHPEAHLLPEGLSVEEQLAWFSRPRDPLPAGSPVQ